MCLVHHSSGHSSRSTRNPGSLASLRRRSETLEFAVDASSRLRVSNGCKRLLLGSFWPFPVQSHTRPSVAQSNKSSKKRRATKATQQKQLSVTSSHDMGSKYRYINNDNKYQTANIQSWGSECCPSTLKNSLRYSCERWPLRMSRLVLRRRLHQRYHATGVSL